MTYIQNDHYLREQAWFLTRIVRIVGKGSDRTRTLRVRIRNKHRASDGSYAVVESWSNTYQSTNGWVEVLSRDIQHLRCRAVSYIQEDGDEHYALFNQDAIDLVNLALEVLTVKVGE